MLKKTAFYFVPFIVSGIVAVAQTNFTGTWKFTTQESVSGNLYSNGSPSQIKIAQTATNLMIEKVAASGDGKDVTITDVVGADGKAAETKTAGGRKKVVTGEWSADKKTFTETANIYSLTDAGHVDHKVVDTYALSDDGRSLTLDRRDENGVNGEVWESVATYQKQN